jgi:hypothetical protein
MPPQRMVNSGSRIFGPRSRKTAAIDAHKPEKILLAALRSRRARPS